MALITDIIDFLEDPITGDIVVTDDIQFSSGVDAVNQGIGRRLKKVRGEFFADLSRGLPYIDDPENNIVGIIGNKFDEVRVRDAMRAAILETPNVNEILTLTVVFVREERLVRVTWNANTVFGEVNGSAVL